MNPTEREKNLVLKLSNNKVPIGPPTNLPSSRGLTSFRFTFSFFNTIFFVVPLVRLSEDVFLLFVCEYITYVPAQLFR